MAWTNDEMCQIAVDLEIKDGLFINLLLKRLKGELMDYHIKLCSKV